MRLETKKKVGKKNKTEHLTDETIAELQVQRELTQMHRRLQEWVFDYNEIYTPLFTCNTHSLVGQAQIANMLLFCLLIILHIRDVSGLWTDI